MGDSIIRDILYQEYPPLGMTDGMLTEPEVSVSRPARQCISVDLPLPDGPMIAVNSPFGNDASTESRAVTCVSPEP